MGKKVGGGLSDLDYGVYAHRNLGEPDRVRGTVSHWLLRQGPPLAVYVCQAVGTDEWQEIYYHYHPGIASYHQIIEGSAVLHVEGKRHTLDAGDSYFVAPEVRHAFAPACGCDRMRMVVIQTPRCGYGRGLWVADPDAGTSEHYKDRAAFDRLLEGTSNRDGNLSPGTTRMSARWRELTGE